MSKNQCVMYPLYDGECVKCECAFWQNGECHVKVETVQVGV